jgi:hypothetical protein
MEKWVFLLKVFKSFSVFLGILGEMSQVFGGSGWRFWVGLVRILLVAIIFRVTAFEAMRTCFKTALAMGAGNFGVVGTCKHGSGRNLQFLEVAEVILRRVVFKVLENVFEWFGFKVHGNVGLERVELRG